MNTYHDYQEFLTELDAWAAPILVPDAGLAPSKSFDALLKKAAQSADRGVFSPFLYLSLSARLTRAETLLLAAAFSAGRQKKDFTADIWAQLLAREQSVAPADARNSAARGRPDKDSFSGTELFGQSAPLLYEREWEENRLCLVLWIRPRVFLFLNGTLLETPLFGLQWYHRIEQPLPPLGTGNRIFPRIRQCLSQFPGRRLIYLQGQKGSGRKLNYACLAAQSGMSLAVIDYDSIKSQETLTQIRIECLLHHAMPVFELAPCEDDLALLLSWLTEEETVFLLGEQETLPAACRCDRQYLPFSISAAAVLGDKQLFDTLTNAYPWNNENERRNFLGRYNFLPGKMKEILELAMAYARSSTAGRAADNCKNTHTTDARITEEHLRQAVLCASTHSLGQYAKKLTSPYRMKDLILPDLQKQKLTHIIHRVRNQKLVYEEWGFAEKSAYGNGVSMIFAGPPGTGKTMGALCLAAELGMELYRIELPSVVDKYIGETEKKLSRIFAEAEKSMAILFFDEADVLFSKRTEIKEANDKYSNMEIAFLLQKMEEYEGVSILATNYLKNFDSAFRRRISDIIDFPLPDTAGRRQMWQSMIPARLPAAEDVDFDFLSAQFELTGSMIKNALIYAGFLAAEAKDPLLTMERILKGICHELEKSGKKLSRDEYGAYGHLFERQTQ